MNKLSLIACVGTASSLLVASSADAGILGFAAFVRPAGISPTSNVIVDLVAVTERASDRLLNVFNVQTASTFIQQAGTATRGFKPDAASSTRSNIVDSFCTIGVEGGAPYYGQYYASGATGADGGFSTGWTTLGTTIPNNAGWFVSPPTLPDNASESLANFTGSRVNSSTAAAGGSFGVWVGHWVFAAGTNSALISITASGKDGITGATGSASVTNFQQIPAPGALALLGLAGAAGSRRRRN
jgi:MYXO-CTERM domain-containing protein